MFEVVGEPGAVVCGPENHCPLQVVAAAHQTLENGQQQQAFSAKQHQADKEPGKHLLFADQIKQAELPMQEKQHGKGSQPAKQHSPKAQQVAEQLIVVNTESMKNQGAEQPEEEQQCRVVIVPVVVRL